MADPARALAVLEGHTRTGAEAGHLLTMATAVTGNRGQVAAMYQLLLADGLPSSPTDALFYAGDDAARPEIGALERALSSGADTTWVSRAVVLFWGLWLGESLSAQDARRYLAALDEQSGELGPAATACLTAARLGDPDAHGRLLRVDSMVDRVPGGDQLGVSILIVARCHEAMGDRGGALAMLSRRALDPVYGPRYLAGYLYDEGRLSLLAGDRVRALRAWRHFLVLRDEPDPALRPQVAMVRRVVDSLARK